MRRLYPRGPANKGICVDDDGAMLGPDRILVHRTRSGFRPLERNDAARLQKCVLGGDREADWLFRQCQRISDALDKGEVALAQIYGLRIPIEQLDDWQLGGLARIAIGKAFNPDQPRLPKGDPHGGEWMTERDDGGVADGSTSSLSDSARGTGDDGRGGGSGGNQASQPEIRVASTDPAFVVDSHRETSHDEPILTEIDFSDGFHDAVVDAWVKALNEAGTPAIKTVGLRLIDTDGLIVGYADILIRAPGLPVEAFAVRRPYLLAGPAHRETGSRSWRSLSADGRLRNTHTRLWRRIRRPQTAA